MIMEKIIKFDAWLMQRQQTVYDYLLDRCGLLVGTFRTITLVISLVFTLFSIGISPTVAGFIIFAFTVIFDIALFYSVIKAYLEVENKLQLKGKYNELNARAMFLHGRHGLNSRFLMLAIIGFLAFLFSSTFVDVIKHVMYAILILNWFYSCGVLVRDRNKSRFEKKVTKSNIVMSGA